MKLIRVLTPWWSTTAAWTSASTAAAPAAASTAATHSATSALGTVVNQEGVERQGIGQDVIPNVGASDGECVQILRLLVLDGHFDGFEMSIHGHVDTSHGSVDLCPILELNCHSLVTEFHQKAHQLHFESVCV